MKEKVLIITGFLVSFGIGFMVGQIILIKTQKPNAIVKQVVDRSLDKYTIENLAKDWNGDSIGLTASRMTVVKVLKDYPNFTSNEFVMTFSPDLSGKNMKKVSGMINIPKSAGTHPLLIMIRGYVAPSDYFIGNGTINSSIFFANNGFITVSPDFLGYGDSDKEPDNIFEARFQTYTTLMSLLNSAKAIPLPMWDGKNIAIWAHSNGGQIALTTIEITGITYPTVLWAPVSASFPYSILYYTDEADDKGKALRRELAKFEEVYNTDLYSLTNYLGNIKATIQLDQGTADTAVPISWSDELYQKLQDSKTQQLQVIYNRYPGADHQMSPLWENAIQKDLEFFRDNLK